MFLFSPPFLRLFSFASIVLVWLTLSWALGSDFMPGPLEVLRFIAREWERGTLIKHLSITFQRVFIGFALGMVLGTILGMLSGRVRAIDLLLEGWLLLGLTIPRVVLFVMAYLMLGLNEQAALVALILAVLPSVVVQIREGARALDPKLSAMAFVYARPPVLVWRLVVLPQLTPYLLGTARAALSTTWKMIVLAEILGRTSGVGYQISFYFQMFNMLGILAYGLSMMVILAVIDITFVNVVQRRLLHWREVA